MRHIDGVVRRRLCEFSVTNNYRGGIRERAHRGLDGVVQGRGGGGGHRQQHQLEILVRMALVTVVMPVIVSAS